MYSERFLSRHCAGVANNSITNCYEATCWRNYKTRNNSDESFQSRILTFSPEIPPPNKCASYPEQRNMDSCSINASSTRTRTCHTLMVTTVTKPNLCLAFMMFLTMNSVGVLRPGSFSMALTILRSATHLSLRDLALL